jgi:hypothetical protein
MMNLFYAPSKVSFSSFFVSMAIFVKHIYFHVSGDSVNQNGAKNGELSMNECILQCKKHTHTLFTCALSSQLQGLFKLVFCAIVFRFKNEKKKLAEKLN